MNLEAVAARQRATACSTALFSYARAMALIRSICIGVLLLGALAACSTFQTTYHGIAYCNAGSSAIRVEEIRYGDFRFIDRPLNVPAGSGRCDPTFTATREMEVPQLLHVRWSTDGKVIERAIPIRSRVVGRSFHSVVVQIAGNEVEVIQRDEVPGTLALGQHRIYP